MLLNIFHTNDIHSHFRAFSKIASYLKKEKKSNDLLLDAGDLHDFLSPEMAGTQGKIGKYLLDYLEYDAITIGNNEGFEGLDILHHLATAGQVPSLSCNLYTENMQEITSIKKSILVNKQGERILIIGVSPGLDYNEFYTLVGLKSKDPVPCIQKELDHYQGAYDLCILLSHLGIDEDKRMAGHFPQIDIIIGGHSHTYMEKSICVNNTIIHHSGCHGQYLGLLALEIENHEITDFKGINIETNDLPLEPGFEEIYQTQRKIAYQYLNQPLFKINNTLWFDPVIENPLTNFIADQLYLKYPCDFAYINSGIVSFGLTGTISKMKLLQASPSHLNPTHMIITGQQFFDAITKTLHSDYCLQEGHGPGFRGMLLGRLHVSKNVCIIMKDNQFQILINDEPLIFNQEYHVVSSDYLQRGTGYPSLKSDKSVRFENGFIRDLLEETLPNLEATNDCFSNRFIEQN